MKEDNDLQGSVNTQPPQQSQKPESPKIESNAPQTDNGAPSTPVVAYTTQYSTSGNSGSGNVIAYGQVASTGHSEETYQRIITDEAAAGVNPIAAIEPPHTAPGYNPPQSDGPLIGTLIQDDGAGSGNYGGGNNGSGGTGIRSGNGTAGDGSSDITGNPIIQSLNSAIPVVVIVLLVVGIVSLISYLAFRHTYEAKIQERRDNALLYEEEGHIQRDVLGAQTLPEVTFDKPLQRGGQQQQQLTKQQQQQLLQQQQMAAQQKAMQQQMAAQQRAPQGNPLMNNGKPSGETVPPNKDPEPTEKPEPTEVPENTFINGSETFKLEHDNYTEIMRNEGDSSEYRLTSGDDIYTLIIREVPKAKTEGGEWASIDEYLESDPNGRRPQGETEEITVGGQDAVLSGPFTLNIEGSSYKHQAVYLFSEDDKTIIAVELNSTELDVNNKDAEDEFKSIRESFSFMEPPDDEEEGDEE